MGKVMGALVRLLVTVAVLGIVGYNTWEVAQLRGEVESLRKAVHAGGAAGAGKARTAAADRDRAKSESAGGGDAAAAENAQPSSGDAMALFQSSKRHADAARAALQRKEFAVASREMSLAAQEAREASVAAGKAGEERYAAMKRTIASVQAEADSLMGRTSGGGAAAAPAAGAGSGSAAAAGSGGR